MARTAKCLYKYVCVNGPSINESRDVNDCSVCILVHLSEISEASILRLNGS